MAKMVLLNAYLSLNANVLSANANKIELSYDVEEKDVTTYGSGGAKEVIGGLKSGTLAIEFKQDFAAAALDSLLWPLLGTVVPFEVRPDQGVASASNPKWTGSVLIKEWKPIQGSVGDEASVGVSFPTSGPVVRAIA